MSWGLRITILYLAFVGMIITLIVLSSRENIDLEYKDYYARELKYQEQIDAEANEKSLTESIAHRIEPEAVVLSLPASMKSTSLTGELHFYRPSDAKLDVKLPLAFDAQGQQVISRSKFSRGMYKLRMNWVADGKTYYKELVLNL